MTASSRFASIDIVRGFAIFIMIEAHLINIVPSSIMNEYAAVLAGPFFLIVAGIGFEMFLISRIQKRLAKSIIALESFSRALMLFLITLVPYIGATLLLPDRFPWIGLLKWSIFQVIATGYIVGYFLRGRFISKICAIGFLFMLAAVTNEMESAKYITNGSFPLLSFLGYFIAGQIIAEIYSADFRSRVTTKSLFAISIASLTAASILSSLPATDFDFFARGTALTFYLICSTLLFILVFMIIVVDMSHSRKLFDPLRRVGNIAFSAYYIHLAAIFTIGAILPTMHSDTSNVVIGVVLNFALLILITCGLAVLERSWKRYEYRYGLEWMLRKSSATLIRLFGETNKYRYKEL